MRRRNNLIKQSTLKYLQSAVEFFKKEYHLNDITCNIQFMLWKDSDLWQRLSRLGDYDIVSNEIRILGCDHYPRNQLINTLFHELIHYWQAKVIKKLKRVAITANIEFCQDIDDNRSLIQDWYHTYPKMTSRIHYDGIDTTDVTYMDKPHEIEARKLAKELFEKWNVPEFKGKI